MKKILIFTTRDGHLSIAQTTAATLEGTGLQVKICDLFSQKGMGKLYTPFYRYFPFLFKVPYKIGENDAIQKTLNVFTEKWMEKEVKNAIKKSQPDLIISAYAFYNPAIGKVLDYQKIPIPFINIATDPWTIHPIVFSSAANFNLVYDEKGVKIGQKNKITKEKLVPIGWLVREEFYKNFNLTKIRKRLGFKKNVFTLLVCGGSEGTNMILKIIPALLLAKRPLQVIVVCGTNENLYKALFSFRKLLKRLPKKPVSNPLNLKLFKFTDQLPQFMSIADLIVGKAGPNLLFEALASKKPFLAICHISGQEDGNLEIIKRKKLGFVEENVLKAIKLLRKIIENPKILNRFQKPIEKERQYNQGAADNLLSVINSL